MLTEKGEVWSIGEDNSRQVFTKNYFMEGHRIYRILQSLRQDVLSPFSMILKLEEHIHSSVSLYIDFSLFLAAIYNCCWVALASRAKCEIFLPFFTYNYYF